jgi:hypothetical protein
MSIDSTRPVPTHDENIDRINEAMQDYILSNPGVFDRDRFIPDNVDPSNMSVSALRDVLQPNVHAVSAEVLAGVANAELVPDPTGEPTMNGIMGEQAYANLHNMTEEEVMWIMEMSQSIMCFLTHLNDMVQERVGEVATSYIRDAKLKGLADRFNDILGGEVQVIDLTDSTIDFPDFGTDADLDNIPPDELL